MKRIVIADDNAGLTLSLKEYFVSSDKYEVVGIASNGVEALALVEKFKIINDKGSVNSDYHLTASF